MISKSNDIKLSSTTESGNPDAGQAAEGWMRNIPAQKNSSPVSANERASLSALIAYVAQNSGENEFRVERRLSDRFNIPNVTCLPSGQFDDAIRYLVGEG